MDSLELEQESRDRWMRRLVRLGRLAKADGQDVVHGALVTFAYLLQAGHEDLLADAALAIVRTLKKAPPRRSPRRRLRLGPAPRPRGAQD